MRKGKGVSVLQKPDKIYLDNPNLSLVFKPNIDKGTLRETFALNQLQNAGHSAVLPPKGDFFIESEGATLEIGGRNKEINQIKNIPNSYIFADDMEMGFGQKIPLYLLGFLY